MTDETKKLFNAPWKCVLHEHCIDVVAAGGCGIGKREPEKTANRIARLPELYDALEEMVDDYCKSCMYIRPHGTLDCKYSESWCLARKHLELLRKVRDGE